MFLWKKQNWSRGGIGLIKCPNTVCESDLFSLFNHIHYNYKSHYTVVPLNEKKKE